MKESYFSISILKETIMNETKSESPTTVIKLDTNDAALVFRGDGSFLLYLPDSDLDEEASGAMILAASIAAALGDEKTVERLLNDFATKMDDE